VNLPIREEGKPEPHETYPQATSYMVRKKKGGGNTLSSGSFLSLEKMDLEGNYGKKKPVVKLEKANPPRRGGERSSGRGGGTRPSPSWKKEIRG